MPDTDRIPYLTERDQVPADGRDHYDAIAESRGRIVAPFAVLLNSPELAGRVADVGAYIRYEGDLSAVDREVAILTTAREQHCAFEWAAHVPIATDAGVDAETVDTILHRSGVDELAEGPATVVRFGRELLGEKRVSDAAYDAAHERFGDRGVVELVATMGYYAMMASVLNAFEVTPDGESPDFA